MSIVFASRPKRAESAAGHRREWHTKCRRYRVTHLDEYGPQPFVACVSDWTEYGTVWRLLSRHRKLSAAKAACEQHARMRQGQ